MNQTSWLMEYDLIYCMQGAELQGKEPRQRATYSFVLSYNSAKDTLVIQVLISSITIPPPPPPGAPPGICTKNLSPPWGFCILAFAGGGGGGENLLGYLPRGRHLSINNFCHFLNFHYNGKNWRPTTLWGLFVALKFYMF